MDQFNWTETALANLEGVTLADVADVLYAKPADALVRALSTEGKIVTGRSDGGSWVIVLLIRDNQMERLWKISFARHMTAREIEEWRRWKSR